MLATTSEAIPAKEEFEPLNFILFLAIVLAAIVGIPLYGYFFGFSLFRLDAVPGDVHRHRHGYHRRLSSVGVASELRMPELG